MSTSEVLARAHQLDDGGAFSFDRLNLRDQDLHAIRMHLYHSSGEGYYVFRRFVSPDIVAHMRSIWTSTGPKVGFELFPGNDKTYIGCPNYYVRYDDGSEVFYNFLFAPPFDEVTCEVSIAVNMLRNRLSGRCAYEGVYGQSSLQYRVTRNINRTTWAAPHTDWLDYEKRWEKGQYDPSRLQATLFLSEKGVDYSGTGFRFSNNNGRSLVFGDDVQISPGDLVIWRYGNLHSIEDVRTEPGQLGFLRIIYPIYTLPLTKPEVLEPLPAKLVRRGKNLVAWVVQRALRAVR
jgi:hypothetical protein